MTPARLSAVAATAVLAALPLLAGGCASHEETRHAAAAPAAQPLPRRAVAHVQPTQGNRAHGTLVFTALDGGGVRITGEIGGLTPSGTHACHLHECGDCSAPDGASAGGHYNPEGHSHGAPGAAEHHAGDFGNLQADAGGVARIDLQAPWLSIGGPVNSVLGRSVIVHAKADDFGQPVGNAGGRIGCGVVGVAKDDAAK